MTPEDVRLELHQVGRELSKASKFIYDYELAAEQADIALQSAIDRTFLTATGSVEERKAESRLATADLRFEVVQARATYNRARLKAKHLELEQMRLMASLKSIQAEGA